MIKMDRLPGFARRAHDAMRHIANEAIAWGPRRRGRPVCDAAIDALARFTHRHKTMSTPSVVLLDGSWDNPSLWLRYTLLRTAIGLDNGHEVGLTNRFWPSGARRTFERLGFARTIHWPSLRRNRTEARRRAKALLSTVRDGTDLLNLALPERFPPMDFYDCALKRQRTMRPDPADPMLPDLLADLLQDIDAVERILDEVRPDLIVLSHTSSQNVNYGAVVHHAERRSIPIVLLTGFYGTQRFCRIANFAESFDFTGAPSLDDISRLDPTQAERLAEIGRSYVERRIGGGTTDKAATLAYATADKRGGRREMIERLGWRADRPIIALYGSVWFDNPHVFGMTNFADVRDWITATYRIANETSQFNWFFRPHPSERIYGGPTLSELLPANRPPHIHVADLNWSGHDVMAAADGLITLFGTAGPEYAVMGKPVLVADRGWYHDSGFAVWARSRAEYETRIAKRWWEDIDINVMRRRAAIFSGWYFGMPAWQGGCEYPEDSLQDAIYADMPEFLVSREPQLLHEIEELRAWWISGERHYHLRKMLRTNSFLMPYVR